jgi:hypothetical protein
LHNETKPKGTPAAHENGQFIGVTSESADSDARADMRMRLQRDIAVLNTIPSQLDPHLTPEDRNSVVFAIPRIKLALMELVWDPNWGNPAEFRRWVESTDERVPQGFEKAAEYFRYDTKAKSWAARSKP